MKRFLKVALAASVLLSATLSANAQFSKKENNREPDRFHMGLRGGGTVNSGPVGNALFFPYGGLAADFQVAPIPIFVETGLYYMNKGFNYEYYHPYSSYYYYNEEKYDDHYIHMPILVSYHLNLAPNLFLQPFMGVTLGYLTESEEFESALRLGVGLNFGRLYMNVGYDIGLTGFEFYDGKNYTTGYDNTFFFTIGFNWAGSR